MTNDSSSHFAKPRFADDGYLDLARIGELLLECLGDVAADFGGFHVVGVFRAGDDSQLAACLNREGLLDAREAASDRLQLLHPLDVPLERLTAGARARRAARLRGGGRPLWGGARR